MLRLVTLAALISGLAAMAEEQNAQLRLPSVLGDNMVVGRVFASELSDGGVNVPLGGVIMTPWTSAR